MCAVSHYCSTGVTMCLHRWKAEKARLEAEYADELAEAKKVHQEKVVKAKKQWEKEQKVKPFSAHTLYTTVVVLLLTLRVQVGLL